MIVTSSLPKVSVVLPTYNSGEWLVEAIESVIAQTWRHLEIIVVDDGSIDETQDLIAPYLDQIQYVRQENKGRSAARNLGITLSTGKYVAFLDADDTWYPEKLVRQVFRLEHEPSAAWACCRCRLVTESGSVFESNFWPSYFGPERTGTYDILVRLLTSGMGISTSTIVVERDTLCDIGGFDETLATSEDLDLWIRLSKTSPLLLMSDVLATRRISTHVTFGERYKKYETAHYGLHVVRKNLKVLKLDPDTSDLARRALYGALMNSVFIALTAEDDEIAWQLWCEAGDILDEKDLVRSAAIRLAYFAISSARYHVDGPAHAEKTLFDLVSRIPLAKNERVLLFRLSRAELFATVALKYVVKADSQRAAYFARKALLASSQHWLNLGIWKIALS